MNFEATREQPKGRGADALARTLFAPLLPHFAALDRLLQAQVAEFEPEVQAMAGYALTSSGKRFRPALVFLSGWQEGGAIDDSVVRVAATIEMVHLATLVHDDIMDRADRRRNRPTVARQWGPAAAVLLGDALFAQAVHLSTQFPTTEVSREVAAAARRVCTGEILQTLGASGEDERRRTYWRILELKTAELFRVSCYLGARVSSAPEGWAEAAAVFGRHLGVAFQVYDDLVDYIGTEAEIGKTLGTDYLTGKLTLPLMLLLDRLPTAERSRLFPAPATGRAAAWGRVLDGLRTKGIAAEVERAIASELAAAGEALGGFASIPAARRLLELVELLRGLTRRAVASWDEEREPATAAVVPAHAGALAASAA